VYSSRELFRGQLYKKTRLKKITKGPKTIGSGGVEGSKKQCSRLLMDAVHREEKKTKGVFCKPLRVSADKKDRKEKEPDHGESIQQNRVGMAEEGGGGGGGGYDPAVCLGIV